MALQFVKDLTQRKYDKLQKDYAYDEQMHKAEGGFLPEAAGCL